MESFGRPSHEFYKLQNVRKKKKGAENIEWTVKLFFSKLAIECPCVCLKLFSENDGINCHLLSSKKMMD